MTTSPEFLEAIRKVLNETRQDRNCRAFLQKRPQAAIVPYLGNSRPAYFFLGVNPSGCDIEQAPGQADDYIDFASQYFAQADSDKASFAGYLPYTANHSGDYEAFGQTSCCSFLVPIWSARSAEVTAPLARACWPRTRRLIEAIRPPLVLIHGSLAWKLLTGQDEESLLLVSTPESHRQGIPEMYQQLEADQIPFFSAIEGVDPEYRPCIVALPHLGGTGGGKDTRRKAEQAVQSARRRLSSGTSTTAAAGGRIRVRVSARPPSQ